MTDKKYIGDLDPIPVQKETDLFEVQSSNNEGPTSNKETRGQLREYMMPEGLKKSVGDNNTAYEVKNSATGGMITGSGSRFECGVSISDGYPQMFYNSWDEPGTFDPVTKEWTHNGIKSQVIVRLFPDGLKHSTDGTVWTAY
ncbi:MAG: hypothetical protein LBP76_09455 [Treponema sp.]|jgi:hypothetical protein|nr:hypothetical protein [Treponema sp.]